MHRVVCVCVQTQRWSRAHTQAGGTNKLIVK